MSIEHCGIAAPAFSHVSGASRMPSPQSAEQSASFSALQPLGQHMSCVPPLHVVIVE
jgi:hypothetical protein